MVRPSALAVSGRDMHHRLDWDEWGSLEVRGTPPQCPRASIIRKPGERPPAPWSNNGLVPRTAHVGSDPVHQDRTESRGFPPISSDIIPSELKSSPPSLKNLSAVVIYASQTGRGKSGSYACAGHYLITVPCVPLTPP